MWKLCLDQGGFECLTVVVFERDPEVTRGSPDDLLAFPWGSPGVLPGGMEGREGGRTGGGGGGGRGMGGGVQEGRARTRYTVR